MENCAQQSLRILNLLKPLHTRGRARLLVRLAELEEFQVGLGIENKETIPIDFARTELPVTALHLIAKRALLTIVLGDALPVRTARLTCEQLIELEVVDVTATPIQLDHGDATQIDDMQVPPCAHAALAEFGRLRAAHRRS